ncbi:MAG TPA: hypothetical protein VNQ53_08925 [Nocardioides sp.]|nr:hypothetical protein [Nocardioides sp.]
MGLRALIAAAAATGLLVGGCGDETGPERATEVHDEPVEGDEPITPRAIAAVALEHVSIDTYTRHPWTGDGKDANAVGADLDNNAGSGLRVIVRTTTADPCAPFDGALDGCDSRAVDGGRLVVYWQELEPEEDPGIVHVVMIREDESVDVEWTATEILGDPREQSLGVSVEEMEAVAQDQRISLTTSAEVIELGEKLDDFSD